MLATKLYVGHKDRNGDPLGVGDGRGPFDTAFSQACLTLSREFGGCTTFAARGWFVLSSGKLIAEDTTVIEVAHEDTSDAIESIACVARYLADWLNQECVLIASTPLQVFDFIKP